jgi:hypothetical protein
MIIIGADGPNYLVDLEDGGLGVVVNVVEEWVSDRQSVHSLLHKEWYPYWGDDALYALRLVDPSYRKPAASHLSIGAEKLDGLSAAVEDDVARGAITATEAKGLLTFSNLARMGS